MLARLATISAILLWAPGVGITIYRTQMLAPYEIFIVLLMPAIVISSFQRRRLLFGLTALGICSVSFLNSLDRSASGIYLAYYVLIIIPHMLLFVQIFDDDHAARVFLSSFVKTGVWLGPLALIQFVSPVQITLINNTDYSLQTGLHRTQLFTPEASILAALYTVAICLAIYNSFSRTEQSIPGDRASYFWLAIGLGTTVSTSVFAVLPPLLLLIFRLCGISWKKLLKYSAVGAVLLGTYYILEYRNRIATGDSVSSSLVRVASMYVGARMVAEHWMTGLGLGMSKTVNDAVKLLYFTWSHDIEDKPGIDSFQLALMAEMGVLPGVISTVFMVDCYRKVRAVTRPVEKVQALVAVFSICIWFVSLLTSGYRGLAYCWLFFPAGYVVFCRSLRRAESATLNPVPQVPIEAG